MNELKSKVINAVYNKRTEIHYNSLYIQPEKGKQIKIELQGKVKCPLLNTSISSLVCSKLMDREDWPRGIDPEVCKNCNCYIYLSIQKFKDKKPKE